MQSSSSTATPPSVVSSRTEVERQRSPTIQNDRSQQQILLDLATTGTGRSLPTTTTTTTTVTNASTSTSTSTSPYTSSYGRSNNRPTTTTTTTTTTLSPIVNTTQTTNASSALSSSNSNSSSYPSSSNSSSSYPSSSSNSPSSYVRNDNTTRTRNSRNGDSGLPSLSPRSPSLISSDSSYIPSNNNNVIPRYNNNNQNGFNYINNNNSIYQRPQTRTPMMIQPRELQPSSFHSRMSTTSRTTTTSAAAARAMPQTLSREQDYTLPGAVRMNGTGTARRQDHINVDDMTIDSQNTWLPSTSIVIQQGDSGRTIMNNHHHPDATNNGPLHAIVEAVDDTGNGGASSTGGGAGEQSITTGTTNSQFGGGGGTTGGGSTQQQPEQDNTTTASNTTTPKQRKEQRWWHNRYIRIFLLGLLSIIIGGGAFGIVFAIIHVKNNSNETDNNEQVIQEIKSTMYPIFEQYGDIGQQTITQIDIDGTPQNQAFQFLMNDPHIQNSILTPSKTTTSFYSQERYVGRFVLATFYFSTYGKSWTIQNKWLSYQSNECQWFGIVSSKSKQQDIDCFSKTGSSNIDLNIDLRSNNLQGSVPIEIRYLETLEFLDLSDNMIVSIPLGHIFELPNLFGLALYDNQLHDDLRQIVDDGCSSSTSSTAAAPGNNNNNCQTKYTGSKLRELTLGDNQYIGQLPESISSLSNLVTLILEKNINLGGTIPESYCNLFNLKVITVFETAIEGEMPQCFCDDGINTDNDNDNNHPFEDLRATADCNSRLSDFSCSCCEGC